MTPRMSRLAWQRNAGRARRGAASASSRSCTPPCCTQPSAHGSVSSYCSVEQGTSRSCRWQHARARRQWLAPSASSRRFWRPSRRHQPAPLAPLASLAAPPAALLALVSAFGLQSAAGRPSWQPPTAQALGAAGAAAPPAAPATPPAAPASPGWTGLVDLVEGKLRPPPLHPPPRHLQLPRVEPSLEAAQESVGRG